MRYFVESYGCTMNHGEGNQLSEKMRQLGHEKSTIDDADIVILNTCVVIETTEKKMIQRMNQLKKDGKKIIVTGCMAKVQPKRISIRLPNSLIIPPDEYDKFSEEVKGKYGSSNVSNQNEKCVSCILPIAQGCLGNCSYCITRKARGSLRSYSENDIEKEFKSMLDAGAKEILITAQDTACYGFDMNTNLPSLMKKLLQFDGDYRIRIGMMNPDSLEKILDELLDSMNDERVYKFLHIPVQSGSNPVLKKMNRRYTVESFFEIVKKIRQRYPMMSIATDMISGFPGESDDDHKKSIELIEKLHGDTVNITRFSARPGTTAASMDNQIQGNVSKDRSTELTDTKMRVEYSVNEKLIGKRYHVLVTENGKVGTMITRNENYRPIGIDGDFDIGTFLDVEVTGCASTHLEGKVI